MAVASQAIERADSFADRFGIARRYGDYESLAAGADVGGLRGHPALLPCGELDPVPRGAQARAVREAARGDRARGGDHGSGGAGQRCVPHGGDVEPVPARLPDPRRPPRRRAGRGAARGRGRLRVPGPGGSRPPALRPWLAGGATLDLGVYTVQLCTLVLGAPSASWPTAWSARPPSTRSSPQSSTTQGIGSAWSRRRYARRWRAVVASRARGWIDVPAPMHHPNGSTLAAPPAERIEAGYEGEGLRFQ